MAGGISVDKGKKEINAAGKHAMAGRAPSVPLLK
jgi:hypothetical protein